MRLFTFFLFHANVKTDFAWRQFGIVIGNYYRKNHLFNRGNERNRELHRKSNESSKSYVVHADVGNIVFPSTSRAYHAYGLALFKALARVLYS